MVKGTCDAPGCDRPRRPKNRWCSTHKWRVERYGSPDLPEPRPRDWSNVEGRFWAAVDFDGPPPDYAPHLGRCWLWAGRLDRDGYGQFRIRIRDKRRHFGSHRIAYHYIVGPIPEGLVIDHLCRVRNCVNPSHMEPVTNAENIRRGQVGLSAGGWQRAKTHCKWGHEFTPENTWLRQGRWRTCIACAKRRQAEFFDRRAS